MKEVFMKLKLLRLAFLLNYVACNIIHAGEGKLQVFYAGASHIGGRTYQEDRWRQQSFAVGGKQYHLSIVCDGHGGSQVAENVVQQFGRTLEVQLVATKDPKQALLNAFAECDKLILAQQETDQNQPGSTAVMMFIDEYNKKKYIANLGDSRLQIVSAIDGKAIWNTKDHTWATEEEFINNHGGTVFNNGEQKGVALQNNPNRLNASEVSRAFGSRQLKSCQGKDGKYGPVNNVPDIEVFDVKEDEICLLFSDGFTKFVDDWEVMVWNRNSSNYWQDLCTLSDEEFHKKYEWICGYIGNAHCDYTNLNVKDEEIDGNDNSLKKRVMRLFYIAQYIGDYHEKSDNTTIVAVQIKNLLEKVSIDLKEIPIQQNYNDYSVKNIFMNRYFCLFTVLVGSFLYYYYSR
jgi:serine/threonine protein phosphatase PrpC